MKPAVIFKCSWALWDKLFSLDPEPNLIKVPISEEAICVDSPSLKYVRLKRFLTLSLVNISSVAIFFPKLFTEYISWTSLTCPRYEFKALALKLSRSSKESRTKSPPKTSDNKLTAYWDSFPLNSGSICIVSIRLFKFFVPNKPKAMTDSLVAFPSVKDVASWPKDQFLPLIAFAISSSLSNANFLTSVSMLSAIPWSLICKGSDKEVILDSLPPEFNVSKISVDSFWPASPVSVIIPTPEVLAFAASDCIIVSTSAKVFIWSLPLESLIWVLNCIPDSVSTGVYPVLFKVWAIPYLKSNSESDTLWTTTLPLTPKSLTISSVPVSLIPLKTKLALDSELESTELKLLTSLWSPNSVDSLTSDPLGLIPMTVPPLNFLLATLRYSSNLEAPSLELKFIDVSIALRALASPESGFIFVKVDSISFLAALWFNSIEAFRFFCLALFLSKAFKLALLGLLAISEAIVPYSASTLPNLEINWLYLLLFISGASKEIPRLVRAVTWSLILLCNNILLASLENISYFL